ITLYVLANFAYLSALPVTNERPRRIDRAAALAKDAEERAAILKEKGAYLHGAPTVERGIAYAKDDRVDTAVLEQASPGFGVPLMAIAIMISTFGCVNGIILTQARLYYAMARDGLFFQSVGRLNQRGVPAAGLVLQAIWAVVLIFSGSYTE